MADTEPALAVPPNQHSSTAATRTLGTAPAVGLAPECQPPFLQQHKNAAQKCWQLPSPHIVSSRLQLSSLLDSVVDPAALDAVDLDQPFSTPLRAGGAVISTPSTSACDSSSSVTAAKATTNACCYELQQPKGMASLGGQLLLQQSCSQEVWSKNCLAVCLHPSPAVKPVQENAGSNHQPPKARRVSQRDAKMLYYFLSLEKAPKATKFLLLDGKKKYQRSFSAAADPVIEPLPGHSKERALKTTN